MPTLEQLLKERILILDGGMGSMIQQYNLTEEDYRGKQFARLPGSMKGNGDMLCITRPDVIQEIHAAYLEAGADIIETNSLNLTSISMADYGLETYVTELNRAAARIAKEVADKYTRLNPDKPRFVAGSIGPTNKTASISPDVSDPAYRAVTFDGLRTAYIEQITALIEGGADAILIETAFDTLNVKAALMAAERSMLRLKKTIPVMVSFTIAGKSGRLLSGQTLEAAMVSVSHANLLSVGLNCSFGAQDMKPFLKALKRVSPYYISAYPNAGLPNSLGQYDETPETMAVQIKEYIDEGLVNIIGGCCGTTPAHIAAIAKLVDARPSPVIAGQTRNPHDLLLSGLDVLTIHCNIPNTGDPKPATASFTLIGERCNVAGSRKFLRLIKEEKYEEALSIARKQVDDGAQILDVNVDDGLLDGVKEMTTFLNLMASEPDVARVPVMIDSSNWEIIEVGLKCLQGKSIVNSISLKAGEEDFLEKARAIRSYGAAVIAMAFDEKGQADTFERKIEIATREYRLLTERAGFPPSDIIFDPNVLAVATGMEEHANYGSDFIRAVEWIKNNLPGAKVSGGVSNLSFAFRGNDYLREAMHAVFLYHCIRKGMDMGIVNPASSVLYEDIAPDLRDLIEDVILNRRPDAAEHLIEYAQHTNENRDKKEERQEDRRALPLVERLQQALIKGVGDFLEEDLAEALQLYNQPVDIIDQVLMEGMNTVGSLFADGKMFLPQVVKTARTMKKAVAILQPAIEAGRKTGAQKAGKILLATVKGDVHDIGKNITGVILSCNNYEIIDIGVMVPPEEILRIAKENDVDLIGLSGLITPSLQEMSFVASELEKAGFTRPLLIGGAATSRLHTALKIAPLYHGPVVHVPDASQAVPVANQLLNSSTKEDYIHQVKESYQALRDKTQPVDTVSLEYARAHSFRPDWSDYEPPKPSFIGTKVLDAIPVKTIRRYMNWGAFLAAWKFPVKYGKYMQLKTPEEKQNWPAAFSGEEKKKVEEAIRLMEDAQAALDEWSENDPGFIKAIIGFYPVTVKNDSLIVKVNPDKEIRIPVLRQQEKRDDEVYKSVGDFVKPEGDFIGFFAATAGKNEKACDCPHPSDDYAEMLRQLLRDRLAEAAAEYLHEHVRKTDWGYAPDESYTPEELLKASYRGIRPASGYPSLPDLSLNFILDELLDMKKIGIRLTPNGAMDPNASVAGLYFAHPESDYFRIGKIAADQLTDYAARKGASPEETQKWLG
ncbi:MAG: methionine synthase [Candidatus Azobacteroides sp.]|nr:methionine synthase [Candidatus Azobacteroides sp.]